MVQRNECIGGPLDGAMREYPAPKFLVEIPAGLTIMPNSCELTHEAKRVVGSYKKVMIPVWVWEGENG